MSTKLSILYELSIIQLKKEILDVEKTHTIIFYIFTKLFEN